MRLDKYLKVSRIIKRRTVANEACDNGRVMLNDKVARARDVYKRQVFHHQLEGDRTGACDLVRLSQMEKAPDLLPVSYTHLDVYKRQSIFQGEFHIFRNCTHVGRRENRNIEYKGSINRCLLYTSRCV